MFYKIIDKVKYTGYRMTYGTYFKYLKYVRSRNFLKYLRILDSCDTIDYIWSHKCSVSRYGDGELHMVQYYLRQGESNNYNIDTFQHYTPEIGKRLTEILMSESKECLVCLPYVIKNKKQYRGYIRFHFLREYADCMKVWNSMMGMVKRYVFGDSCFTRFYFQRTDIKDYKAYVTKLKKLWEGRHIVFLEGEYSRLGVGNDLFDNAASIERFLLPSTNAFDKYDEIIEAVKGMNRDKLYLLAIGHTATVLAYDMAHLGFQAIDIGHIDIEYEWMKMGATEKVTVKNKYVNEVQAGRISSELEDPLYQSQIIGRII